MRPEDLIGDLRKPTVFPNAKQEFQDALENIKHPNATKPGVSAQDRGTEGKWGQANREYQEAKEAYEIYRMEQLQKDVDTYVNRNVPQVHVDTEAGEYVFSGTQEALKSELADNMRSYLQMNLKGVDIKSPTAQQFAEALNKDVEQQVRNAVVENALEVPLSEYNDYAYAIQTMKQNNPMISKNLIGGYDKDGKFVKKTPKQWIEYWQKAYSPEERAKLYYTSAQEKSLYKRLPFLIMSGGMSEKPQYGFTTWEKINAFGGAFTNELMKGLKGAARGIVAGDENRIGKGIGIAAKEFHIPKMNVTSKNIPWMSREQYWAKMEEVKSKPENKLTSADKLFILANNKGALLDLGLTIGPVKFSSADEIYNTFLNTDFTNLDQEYKDSLYQNYIEARGAFSTYEKFRRESKRQDEEGVEAFADLDEDNLWHYVPGTYPEQKLDMASLYASGELAVGSLLGNMGRYITEAMVLKGLHIPVGDIGENLTNVVMKGLSSRFGPKIGESFLARFLVGVAADIPEDIIQTAIDDVLTWRGDEVVDTITLKSIGENTMENMILRTIGSGLKTGMDTVHSLKAIRKAARLAGKSGVDVDDAIRSATDINDALKAGRYVDIDKDGHIRYRDAAGKIRTYSDLEAEQVVKALDGIDDAHLLHDLDVRAKAPRIIELETRRKAIEIKDRNKADGLFTGGKFVDLNTPRTGIVYNNAPTLQVDSYDSKGRVRLSEGQRGLSISPAMIITKEGRQGLIDRAKALLGTDEYNALKKPERKRIDAIARGDNTAIAKENGLPIVQDDKGYSYVPGVDPEFDQELVTTVKGSAKAAHTPAFVQKAGLTGEPAPDAVTINQQTMGTLADAPETGEAFSEDVRFNDYTYKEYATTADALADMPDFGNLPACNAWHQAARTTAMREYRDGVIKVFREVYPTKEAQEIAVAKWDFIAYLSRKGKSAAEIIKGSRPKKSFLINKGEVEVPADLLPARSSSLIDQVRVLVPHVEGRKTLKEWIGESLADSLKNPEGMMDIETLKNYLTAADFKKLRKEVKEFLTDAGIYGFSTKEYTAGYNRADLPKIKTSSYTEATGIPYKEAPKWLKPHLSQKTGLDLGDSAWGQYLPRRDDMDFTANDLLDFFETIYSKEAVPDFDEYFTKEAIATFFEQDPKMAKYFEDKLLKAIEKESGVGEKVTISGREIQKIVAGLLNKAHDLEKAGEDATEAYYLAQRIAQKTGAVKFDSDIETPSFNYKGQDVTVTQEDIDFYVDNIEPAMEPLRQASRRGLKKKPFTNTLGYLPQSDYSPEAETAEGMMERGRLWRRNRSKMVTDGNGNFTTSKLNLDLENRLDNFANNMLWDALGDRTKAAKLAEELSADGENVTGEEIAKLFKADSEVNTKLDDTPSAREYQAFTDEAFSEQGTTLEPGETEKAVEAKAKIEAKKAGKPAPKKEKAPKELDWDTLLDKMDHDASEVGAAKAVKSAYSHIYRGASNIIGQPKHSTFMMEGEWMRQMATKSGTLYDWASPVMTHCGDAMYMVRRMQKGENMHDIFIEYLTQGGRRTKKGAEYIAKKWEAQIAQLAKDQKIMDENALVAKLSDLARKEGMNRLKKWVATADIDSLNSANLKRLNSLIYRNHIVANDMNSNALMTMVDKAADKLIQFRSKALFYMNFKTGVLQLSETNRLFTNFKLGDANATIAKLATDNDFREEVDFWVDALVPEDAKLQNADLSMKSLNGVNDGMSESGGRKFFDIDKWRDSIKGTGEQVDEALMSPVELGEKAKNYILVAGCYQEASRKGLTGQALYEYMQKKFQRVGIAATQMSRLGYMDSPFMRVALNLKSFTIRELGAGIDTFYDNLDEGGAKQAVNYLMKVFGAKAGMALIFSKLGYDVVDILGIDPFGLTDNYTGLDEEDMTAADKAVNTLLSSGMTGFLADYYFAARKAYEYGDNPEEEYGLAAPSQEQQTKLLRDTLLGFVPGYNVARRVGQTAELQSTGFAISDSGNRMFEAPTSEADLIKGYFFGRGATERGMEYFQQPDILKGIQEHGLEGAVQQAGRVFGDFRQFDPIDKENYSDWFDGSFADEQQWTSGMYHFQDEVDELKADFNERANKVYDDDERLEITNEYNRRYGELLDQLTNFVGAYTKLHDSIDGNKMRRLLNILNTFDYDVISTTDENKDKSMEAYNRANEMYSRLGLPQTVAYRGATEYDPEKFTEVQESPQFKAALQGRYGIPTEASKLIQDLYENKWKNLRKEYSAAAYSASSFDEREKIQRAYMNKIGEDLDGIIEAYGTDILTNDAVDDIMEDVFTGMIPYKDWSMNKRGRINPSTPLAEPDVSDWLKAAYRNYDRSGSYDYKSDAEDTIYVIQAMLDDGHIAAAKSRARILLQRVKENRAFVDRETLEYLKEVVGE